MLKKERLLFLFIWAIPLSIIGYVLVSIGNTFSLWGMIDNLSFVLLYVCLCYALTLIPWKSVRIAGLIVFAIINIAFFWGSLLYYRAFHGWVRPFIFGHLDELPAVMPSLGSLVNSADYIFLILIPLLSISGISVIIAHSNAVKWKRRYLILPALAIGTIILHSIFSGGFQMDAEVNPLINLFRQEGFANRSPKESIFARHLYIGHAFGEIGGVTYTNSLEAFQENYRKGRRVFEVDFSVTADNEVICFHDGKENLYGFFKRIRYVTLREFKSARIAKRYTPLDSNDLIEIMRNHEDVHIVTDTKGNFQYILRSIVQKAQKADPDMLDRIIPQIYNERDYFQAMTVYPFPDIIYTLYRTRASDQEIIQFIKNKPNLTGLTVSTSRFDMGLSLRTVLLGKYVFVHTINNDSVMDRFRRQGAYGFYTDNYFPKRGGESVGTAEH